MSLTLSSRRAALAPGPWVRNELWRRARAVPSLDLRFAGNKSLVDAATGQSLVTFTRASSGTYVGSDGLIKTATTNLLLRSEEFDNASWITFQSGFATANTTTAPNGSTTADTLSKTTTANGILYQLSPAGSGTYTFSCYCKANTAQYVWLGCTFSYQGRACTYDLSAGTAGAVTNGPSGSLASITGGTSSIFPVGNGWYRVVLAGITVDQSRAFHVGAGQIGSTTAESVYIWGAQLEQSSTVGEYIPTTSTINSAPRFDHSPTTGESLGLLVEEQRTNSIRNNTMVGAVAGTPGTLPTNWVATGSANGITREVIGTGTENGVTYADIKYSGTANTATNISISFEGNAEVVAAQNDVWIMSLYAKLVGGSWANTAFSPFINSYTSAGVFDANSTSPVNVYSNPTSAALQTQRYTARGTLSSATTARVNGGLFSSITNGAAIDFTLRIGMPQLEQGAFATSVIPTSTTAVTRNADVASITGANFSSWYRQDEGTVFAEGSSFDARTNDGIFLAAFDNNSISNEININRRIASYLASFGITTAGVTQADIFGSAWQTGFTGRCVGAFKANDAATSFNGGTVATDATVTVPTVDRLQIGRRANGFNVWNGTIRRLTYFPQRLSNSVLQELTR